MDPSDIPGASPSSLSAVTIRDLRQDRSLAPGGAAFADLVQGWLPVVYGSAARQMPGQTEPVEGVVSATFQALAIRWRRLPKRTVVASWLLRSLSLAVAGERKRLRLATPASVSLPDALFAQVRRRSDPGLDAVILNRVLGLGLGETARGLRCKETRAAKLVEAGLGRLAKIARKAGGRPDALGRLEDISVPAPDELRQRVVHEASPGSAIQTKDPRVRTIVWAWRWIGLRRLVRRVCVSFAVTFLILSTFVGVVAWLAKEGYLSAWFIGQSGRRLAKEMPEITQPARPWPERSADRTLLRPLPPRTAADLYSLTNIWVAELSFTPEQWKGISPSRVRPVPIMHEGGVITLRNPNARRNGLAGVVGIDFNWTSADLEFAGESYPEVAVRYRGNGTYINSLFGPKQSLKVDLNRFQKGRTLAGTQALNFVNSIPDNSYLHDALAQQLFRDLGVPGPRTAYAYVSLHVPGVFDHQALGLYVMVENIDGTFAADRFGAKDTPIFKPVTPELFRDLGQEWTNYAGIYDLKTKATTLQLQRVMDFARLVTSADDATFAERLPEFLDLEEFAGFLAGHVLISSYDGFLSNGQNFYLYLDPRTDRFGFIPWDQDHGWGEFGYVATADRRERASIWQPGAYHDRFLERVLRVESFRAIYRRRLEQAMADLFTVERLYAQVDRLAAILRPAVAAESDFRLRRFDQSVSTNWLPGPRDSGEKEGPKAPVHQIKRFIANRVKSVADQLAGRTEGVLLRAEDRH